MINTAANPRWGTWQQIPQFRKQVRAGSILSGAIRECNQGLTSGVDLLFFCQYSLPFFFLPMEFNLQAKENTHMTDFAKAPQNKHGGPLERPRFCNI